MSNTNFFSQDFLRSEESLAQLEKLRIREMPNHAYIIAMTPRSGSSYLCEVMEKTKQLGRPGEALNPNFIPNILKKIPGHNAGEYLQNYLKFRKSPNGVSGIKTSWFQYALFREELEQQKWFQDIHFIYLIRRDIISQGISLYKATESNVFHTNVEHSKDALNKLAELDYDYARIDYWVRHIEVQEAGWKQFFYEKRITPLYISYEDVEENVLLVIRKIAQHVGLNPNIIEMPKEESVFKKLRDQRSFEWAIRYQQERFQKQGLS